MRPDDDLVLLITLLSSPGCARCSKEQNIRSCKQGSERERKLASWSRGRRRDSRGNLGEPLDGQRRPLERVGNACVVEEPDTGAKFAKEKRHTRTKHTSKRRENAQKRGQLSRHSEK